MLLGSQFNARILSQSPTEPLHTELRVRVLVSSPFNEGENHRSLKCGRLFWYTPVVHDGARYIVSESTNLYIIATNPKKLSHRLDGSRLSAYDAPFSASGPNSDDYLFNQPFYFSNESFAIGGWGLRDSWWRPTEPDFTTFYNVIADDIGEDMPAVNDPHGLLLYLRFRRHYRNYPNENQSGAGLLAVHLTEPGLIPPLRTISGVSRIQATSFAMFKKIQAG